MKHYDGPAFYRKYGQLNKAAEWQLPGQSAAPKSATSADKAESADTTSASQQAQTATDLASATQAPSFQQSAANPSHSTGLQQPETHVKFTPGHMANRLLTREPNGQVSTKIFDKTLKLVMQRLDKDADSFFVFGNSDDFESPATAISEESEIETFYPDSQSEETQQPASVETTTTVESAADNQPVDVVSETPTSEEPTTTAPTVVTSSAPAESSAPTPQAETVTTSVEKPVNEAEAQADVVAESEAPEDTTKMGLGVSLNEIFNEEDNAQKDLALFRPKVTEKSTPDVSVGDTGSQPDSVEPTPEPAKTRQIDAAPVPVETSSQPTTEATESEQPAAKPASAAAIFKTDKELAAYQFPPLNLLTAPVIPDETEMDEWIQSKADALDQSLSAFGVNAHVVDWTIGPTVTQFQVKLAQGVRVSKITNLNDDLKLALAAKDIRIEAPIPGRNTVGIEIPNQKSRPVMLAEVLNSEAFKNSKSPLTVALGVDLFGQPQVTDLRKMPHGLIAGATGSGKSVFINSILVSILYKANPQQVKMLLIDPKAVELAPYNDVPHLIAPVISEPKAASAALKWVVDEMEDRYQRLAAGGVRNIEQFNAAADAHHEPALKMPYIVIVIDELADLMMVASSEVQDYIARITQKARAAGIHLLVATQRPSVDVVTGTIKNNIPTRVAFMVASQIDSRTILDTSGAERLLGRGDMLYLGNGQSQPIRLQGTFVDHEIDAITSFVKDQAAPHYEFQPDSLLKHKETVKNQDELLPEVLEYLADEDTVSTSKLQRTFSVGYNRAANIIDDLENRNYISAAKGSKPRDVYFDQHDLEKVQDQA